MERVLILVSKSKDLNSFNTNDKNVGIDEKQNQEQLRLIQSKIQKFETLKDKEVSLREGGFISFESTLLYILITFLIVFGKQLIDKRISKKKRVMTFSESPLTVDVEKVAVQEFDISEIEKEIKLYEIAKNEPHVFINLYIKTYPIFYRILSEKLIDSEIEICAFTKLNFDTKHIARLKDVTVRSVEGKKYRIRKKLQIDPSIELVDWLRNNT